MKTKTVVILCFVAFTMNALGQVNYNIVDTNSVWYVYYVHSTDTPDDYYSENEIFSINSDTLIETKKYNKLLLNGEFIGGIREDSFGIVYFYPKEYNENYCIDPNISAEYVLYNFTLNVEDTISNNEFCWNKIYEYDSVFINNDYRKSVTIHNYGQREDTWIEGIGSIKGLLYPIISEFEENYELLCYAYKDEVIYSNPRFNGCLVETVTITGDFSPLVSPNPFEDKFAVSFHNSNTKRIFITNTFGQIVYDNLTDLEVLEIGEIVKSGIYFMQIKQNNTVFNSIVIKL